MKTIVIGTRGSPLALAQVEIITSLLQKAHLGLKIERKIIKTSGDKFLEMSLSAGAGKGLFTKEIEEQLLAGTIDLAIHSMKDLPTQMPEGLTIGAVPAREDPHDVLVSQQYRSVDELPKGARVATSSVRRKAQLLARRPDLQILEIRGNVGTRLQKSVDFDAIILAAAGLKRLGLKAEYVALDFDVMIPAVGQGIIACQCREDDMETQESLAAINHAHTLACAEAERVFLREMGGGCQLPFAAHAFENLKLIAARFEPEVRRVEVTGTDPHELGERAAKELK
jgi:hydroxymethylbilane synthase